MLPPTLSAPDGKLRAIGHMSKAMTEEGQGTGRGLGKPEGLFCACIQGGPGDLGVVSRSCSWDQGHSNRLSPKPLRNRCRGVASVLEVYRVGEFPV